MLTIHRKTDQIIAKVLMRKEVNYVFLDFEGESFYQFAMALFMEAGHVFTSTPEYNNHSAERFAYFDNKSDASLSPTERALLKRFNNVSRLFTVNDCAFFSINLFSTRSERSELAHNIHIMLHPLVDTKGTICAFRFEDEVMLSFMGFGYHCILSDWYPMFDPYDELLHRLDIVNMSINSGREYFEDLIYNLAREYYIVRENASAFTLLPIDALTRLDRDEITREDLDEIIREEVFAAYKQYGDDYIEYDESAPTRNNDISSDLDLMLLDMDMEEDDNPFGEEIEEDDIDSDEEENLDRDDYEFSDVDPEVFRDPTLLVKLLKRQAQEDRDSSSQ